MSRDKRYDPLFEPLAIGPVTAKNRFYQVPHCNGGGYRDPSAAAAMRGVKAEGGWAVVFTEQVEMHHSSEITPFIELRLWEDKDIPMLARMAETIKAGGALAGIQLAYPGINGPNLYSRDVAMAPTALPIRTFTSDPVQARAMDLSDIADLRHWYRLACRRAKQAGFDLICLYGAHSFGVIQHFLSRTTNHRSDAYGGSLENRARLLKELVSDAKDEVGDACGLTVRLSLVEDHGDLGFSNEELRDVIGMHGDLPDLWDLAQGTWEDCSGTSRFKGEAAQEDLVRGIRTLTNRPIVGVGRFTSPDTMLRQVTSGVLDFVGCARPSIADPWLPRKIDEGRIDDIRECIGCNICITGDMTMSPARCTQNPSFMEEWRKGWHPERMNIKGVSRSVLIVGAGPAGLEAAMSLGRRGYEVTLAEASGDFGGRVRREQTLPGLNVWGRVVDYRLQQLQTMANVSMFTDSALTFDDLLAFSADHIGLATGARWRRDAVAREHVLPPPMDEAMSLLTPDDIMDGQAVEGHVVVYDDDHFYMGSVCAEALVEQGCSVTLITPAARLAEWTINTLEQHFIHQRLAEKGIRIRLNCGLHSVQADHVTTQCPYTGATDQIACDALLLVGSRTPDDTLWQACQSRQSEWQQTSIKSVIRFGDGEAPGPIAWATYAGHRYARELDEDRDHHAPSFRRELAILDPDYATSTIS